MSNWLKGKPKVEESRRLRKVINELCTTENEFLTYFEMVEDDIQEVKEKKLKLWFKKMYRYSSSTLSSHLKGMPQDAIYYSVAGTATGLLYVHIVCMGELVLLINYV